MFYKENGKNKNIFATHHLLIFAMFLILFRISIYVYCFVNSN